METVQEAENLFWVRRLGKKNAHFSWPVRTNLRADKAQLNREGMRWSVEN